MVTGLQKPPAGSEEGEEGEEKEMVPVGMRLLIWVGASRLAHSLTGEIVQPRAAPFPAPFHGALEGFQHPVLQGTGASPPRRSWATIFPLGLALYLKHVSMVTRKRASERGNISTTELKLLSSQKRR